MPYPARSLDGPLDDDRRRLLTELEAVGQPTGYSKGALAALALAVLTPDEQRRVDALRAKWQAVQ